MSVGYVRKWTDTGAPTLTSTVGSLVSLLKAVLVDGYGSIPALGWTMPFVSANALIAAFRNDPEDGTGFYWRVLDSIGTSGSAWLYGYEQMTDENTGLLPIHDQVDVDAGDNHWLQYGPTTNPGSLEWIIIGDNTGVWLCFRPWSYSSTTLGCYNWTMAFIGDYIPLQEENHWNAALFCRAASAAAAISTNQMVGTVINSATGSTCYRVARDKSLHYGSIDIALEMGIAFYTNNYIGAFGPTSKLCSMDDPIQPTLPVYMLDPVNGVIGRPPGLRSATSPMGLDGIVATNVTHQNKVYREYDMGTHKFHFFPFMGSSTGWTCYLVIQSGEGFRDAFV